MRYITSHLREFASSVSHRWLPVSDEYPSGHGSHASLDDAPANVSVCACAFACVFVARLPTALSQDDHDHSETHKLQASHEGQQAMIKTWGS